MTTKMRGYNGKHPRIKYPVWDSSHFSPLITVNYRKQFRRGFVLQFRGGRGLQWEGGYGGRRGVSLKGLCDPQLQNFCHYIINHCKNMTRASGGVANRMHPLSWGSHKRKGFEKWGLYYGGAPSSGLLVR